MARGLRTALLLASLLFSNAVAANIRPKAPHLVYRVAANEEVEIELRGYDQDGDKLITTITSLPASGQLYDLSQVYAQHGRTPKVVDSGKITSSNHLIPKRSKHRIVYRAPSFYNKGKWATFKYSVNDGKAISSEGLVTLVPSDTAENVMVVSDFGSGADGWVIVGNGKTATDPVHERSSHKLLNYFIYTTENRLDIAANGFDKALWYFQAPAKFLGFQASAYSGYLSFSLGAFSGDFNLQKRNPDMDFAILECSTCALGKGMRFAYKVKDITFNGSPSRFKLHLSNKGAWLKDPKNTLKKWEKPTTCEFVEMLDNLSAVKILGDFTAWYESVGLDEVQFESPMSGPKSPIPVECLCANPGTQCST